MPISAKGSSEKLDEDMLRTTQVANLTLILQKAKKGVPAFKKFEKETEEQEKQSDSDDVNDRAIESPRAMMAQATGLYFYHPDHLGSSTFITDASGFIYQVFLNLPYGETMAEQHSLTEDYETPYKFNGKELDPETGYYYYGARYYDPRSSIWLSTDPLMEKYPNFNPYAYCFQNPINVIDPTGMEGVQSDHRYKVTQGGDISLVERTNDDFDELFVEDGDGNLSQNSIKLNKGILSTKQSKIYSIPDRNILVDYDFLEVTGNETAKRLYEFLANNTMVEWSWIEFGKDSNYITTTCETMAEGGNVAIIMGFIERGELNKVKRETHSHPSWSWANPGPSPPDLDHAKSMEINNEHYDGNVKSRVYEARPSIRNYIDYNSNGIIIPLLPIKLK